MRIFSILFVISFAIFGLVLHPTELASHGASERVQLHDGRSAAYPSTGLEQKLIRESEQFHSPSLKVYSFSTANTTGHPV